MARETINRSGDEATLRVSGEILERLGLAVGDEVELLLVEHTLVVRPLNVGNHEERIAAATEEVIERRRTAYQELAKGVE